MLIEKLNLRDAGCLRQVEKEQDFFCKHDKIGFICILLKAIYWTIDFGLTMHVSLFQVLSVTLDEWTEDQIDSMLQVGGNSYANTVYEAFLPKDYPKPTANSSNEERTEFIRY